MSVGRNDNSTNDDSGSSKSLKYGSVMSKKNPKQPTRRTDFAAPVHIKDCGSEMDN